MPTAPWGVPGVQLSLEPLGLQRKRDPPQRLQRRPVGEATGASPLPVPSTPPCLHCPRERPPGSLGPWVPSPALPCGPHELHGQPASGRKRGLAGRGWVRRGCGPEEKRLACRFVWMLKLAACECRGPRAHALSTGCFETPGARLKIVSKVSEPVGLTGKNVCYRNFLFSYHMSCSALTLF